MTKSLEMPSSREARQEAENRAEALGSTTGNMNSAPIKAVGTGQL